MTDRDTVIAPTADESHVAINRMLSCSRHFFRKIGAAAYSGGSLLGYVFRRKPWPSEFPVVVQFPVNDICDSKCQMCGIWQQKLDEQITVEQARHVFSSSLFRNVRAVGLNGGEPTLRDDLAELGEMLFLTLPKLKSVSLITNGLHAERAIERIEALYRAVLRLGGHLDVMVSLDGVGDVHDRVRGVQSNFDKAVKVLDKIRRSCPKASVRVGCTVIRDNVSGLHALLDFCRRRGVYVKFRLGVPNRRLYNLNSPGPKTIGKRSWLDTRPFELGAAERWQFGQFLLGLAEHYEPSLQQRQFYRSLSAQVTYGMPRSAGCDWQHRGVTLSSRGELLYCAVQSDTLGDARTSDAKALYFGGRKHLEQIIETKCSSCAHDYVGPPGGRRQLAIVLDEALKSLGTSTRDVLDSPALQLMVRAKKTFIEPLSFAQARARALTEAPARPAPSRRTAILICGWYGTETLGDKAILAAQISLIRKHIPRAEIVIASLDVTCTEVTIAQMPELEHCRVIDAHSAADSVGMYAGVIFGGGPIMAVREIALMEAIFKRAAEYGIPRVLAGCGVGPMGSAPVNRSIRGLLRSATHRIYRDVASSALAERIAGNVDGCAVIAEDPAHLWVRSNRTSAPRDKQAMILGLSLRDWPFRQYARHLKRDEAANIRVHCEKQIAGAIEALIAQHPQLTILPIPFCTHHAGGDDNFHLYNFISRSEAIRSRTDFSLLGGDSLPATYLKGMERCAAMLTMRFHSLVFSSSLGIPSVAIDYTLGNGKIASLSADLGVQAFSMVGIEQEALRQALTKALIAERGSRSAAVGRFEEFFVAALRDIAQHLQPA